MKSDLIEHPCPICLEPSRSCGHTKTDLRAYHDRAREIPRAARQDLVPRKRGGHRVPKEGPGVFREPDDDTRQAVMIPVGGKLLKARMTMPKNMVRTSLTDEEYCRGLLSKERE